MSNNRKNSLEDEFRSSQTYQILSGVSNAAADAVAQGVAKAADAVGAAVNQVGTSVQQTVNNTWRSAQQNAGAPRRVGNPAQPAPGAFHRQAAPPFTPQQPVRQQPYPQPAPRQVPQQAPANVKLVHKGSAAKWYITAATALLYAWNLPLSEPVHYVLFGLAVVGAFFLSSKLFKGKKEFVPVEAPKPKAPEKPKEEEKPSATGNPEVDKIIDEGRDYLKRLRAANDAIPDEALSEDIDRMEKASADIFRYIADHPNKAPQVRKFMNYYLPTTLKLLDSYQRLSSQSVKGEYISSTLFNIVGMMHTVADAFEKQLDALFADEAMDVSAEISVFETLLQQEGLAEERQQKQTASRPEPPQQ